MRKREVNRRPPVSEGLHVPTGVELYLKCFTKRNGPITRNYQHAHGKIMNSNSRANQLNFSFKKIKMTLNWWCCLPRCWVLCFPSDIFVCWIGPAAWNSEPRSAELSLPKQRLEMTCWRIKSDLRTRDTSPVLPCPRTMVEPNYESLTTIRFQTDLGHFMKVKTSFWISKIEKPCWFIQITPKTTINPLSFVYCSPIVPTDTCENCSQYYLGSMYCNKVCNPLIYKSFPYNPCLCKPMQIFNTFLSH